MNYSEKFAFSLCEGIKLTEFIMLGQVFKLSRGTRYSVNNQSGKLRNQNLLARNLEFTLYSDELEIPLVFQLYKNARDHMRLFLHTKEGMLFSVNLTTGYNSGCITLEQFIKYSSNKLSKIERKQASQDSLDLLASENIGHVEGKKVLLGYFDVTNQCFIGTTPEKFLINMIKIGLIKGHYSKNKGFDIRILDK